MFQRSMPGAESRPRRRLRHRLRHPGLSERLIRSSRRKEAVFHLVPEFSLVKLPGTLPSRSSNSRNNIHNSNRRHNRSDDSQLRS